MKSAPQNEHKCGRAALALLCGLALTFEAGSSGTNDTTGVSI
jgi:hypothetical protein